jgi:thiol-disulfide isomerase/thioredoxin
VSLCLLHCLYSYAEGIGIGEKCPDIQIRNIINYKSSSTTISAFKGKLIILDFMATSCISCIEALPKLDSLQKKFADQIQVLVVTYEKIERVRNFLEKNKIGKNIQLPFVAEDSILKANFPHEFISHVVWMDREGIVKAITGTQYLKAENIETVLGGVAINWPVKKEVAIYDYNQPLVVLNENNIPPFSLPANNFYSSFTAYMPGVTRRSPYDIRRKSEYLLDSVNQTERIYMINFPIIHLYLKACNQSLDFPSSRMILNIKDVSRLIFDPSKDYRDVWNQNNTYCYEAVFPANTVDEDRKKKIRADLNFYLGFNGRTEARKVKCLILYKRFENSGLLNSSVDNSVSSTKERVTSISGLVYQLNHILYNHPIIDETGYREKKYLKLSENSISDINLLRRELKKYGLELKEEERIIEMFIITQSNN